jgi:hypothetical protein
MLPSDSARARTSSKQRKPEVFGLNLKHTSTVSTSQARYIMRRNDKENICWRRDGRTIGGLKPPRNLKSRKKWGHALPKIRFIKIRLRNTFKGNFRY